ncbi:unnamed protein product [Pseudo-nitzschia multistriata]|uniref:Uncharacterized protein n=1 Tax=Pseudo-nitzschia multistriata TaxID=183589 RepID=A0A448ZC70_9STRA|nr:unnamed protein product [Pseudo-nitzschia multistriata]
MGTGSSAKSTEQDNGVRDRIDSGEFQKVSPPGSPSFESNTKTDEMSYSGILVEKPDETGGKEQPPTAKTGVPSSEGAIFAADLTSPPISNRSKGRTKTGGGAADSSRAQAQPRRIVKATPPPRVAPQAAQESGTGASSVSVHSGKSNHSNHNAAPLSSPIGNNANAANELLEESIEKNDPKTKQRERHTSRQKNDRERLLKEKRSQRTAEANASGTGEKQKPRVEANPFSRFLSAFSVDANPKHKRKEQSTADAENKRLKYGFQDTSGTHGGAASDDTPAAAAAVEDSSSSTREEKEATLPSLLSSPWMAAAAAAVALLVVAIAKGSRKK